MSEEKMETSLEEDWKSASIKTGIKKHTLDSDEEDDVDDKKYEILDDDDIEGQEEGTAGFEGGVQITPFNMKEEMEEGHFDTEGNYHWNKEGKLIRDNWLENIDWVKVAPRDGKVPASTSGSDSEESTPFDQIPVYRKMLSMMKPGESVAKALQRLGGKKNMSASERWRRKKAGFQDETDGNRQQVIDLTEHANKLLTETGNMDIYQETYEHISSLVEEADRKDAAAHPVPKSYDDALDMYADDFDEKEKARLTDKKHKLDDDDDDEDDDSSGKAVSAKRVKFEEKVDDDKTEGTNSSKKSEIPNKEKPDENSNAEDKPNKEKANPQPKDDEVQWEFKWKEDSTDISGPHPTKQMQTWVEEDYFKGHVWVRKVGQNGPFYSSKRVDFELYL